MKKVLIITYYWPPSGGAGVQRWLKFAKYLPEYGFEPIIYTATNPESPSQDTSLLKDINEGTEVHKTEIWEPFNIYKRFTGRNKNEKFGAGFLSESKAPKLQDNIALWVRGNLFIPDAKRFWIGPSVKYLKKYLKKNPVDYIISTGPPHSTHLIANKLKKQFKTPWVADFRDPWTEIDFYQSLKLSKYADKKHHRLESMVLNNADHVICVGKQMKTSYSKICQTPISVITNGFDTDDIPQKSNNNNAGKFIVSHVGSINGDRNHKIFWQAIRLLLDSNNDFANDFEFQLIGKIDHSVNKDIEQYGLSKWVKTINYIPHSKVIQHLMHSSVLYLPLNNTPNAKGILTGKVFEYFAAQQPILAIGPTDGDLANLINETQTGSIIDFDDEKALIYALENFYSKFQNNSLSINSTKVDQYSRKNLTQQLAETLNTL